MAVANLKPNATVAVQKSTAETLTWVIEGVDLSAKSVQIFVKQFDGDGSYTINVASATPVYSGGNSTVTVSLTTTHTNINWSRGIYTLANVTDNISLSVGEFLVEKWGF